jgi:hypothetical protein
VDQREAFGSLAGAGNDQAGDLHHLSVASGGGLRVPLRGREVAVGFSRLAGGAGHHRTEGVCDRVHAVTMRWRAYSSLTRRR